jgi:hypothetical protein
MGSFIVFVLGFGGGWAVRSLSDSPQGVGVALFKVAHDARERMGHWFATERERIEDMMAEARSDAGHGAARASAGGNGASNGRPVHRGQA